MNTESARVLLVLGDPRGSSVGRHMYESYLAELPADSHEVVILGRDELPSSQDDWSAFADTVHAQAPRTALVFSGQEDLLELAAFLSARFGLPHNPPGVADLVRLKELCRSHLAEAGMPQPQSALVDADGLAGFTAVTTGPWVVKPRDGRGSVDVRTFDDPVASAAVARHMDRYPLYVVEEYVNGHEFSVEGVFISGRPYAVAVTQKGLFPGDHFVEMTHQQPPSVDTEAVAKLRSAAVKALEVVEARAGLFHIEAWMTADGSVVVGEVHLRSGGDWIHTLVSYTRPDAPLFRLAVEDAAGCAIPPSPPTAEGRGAAVRFLQADPGRVIAVEGIEMVTSDPAALHVEMFIGTGDLVDRVRCSDDRIGVVVARGKSGDDASEHAARLASLIRVRTESGKEPGA